MARYMRSYGRSRLSPPAVVGAPAVAFVAQPVATTLATRPRQLIFARARLSPPAVVAAPAAPFVAAPVSVQLSPSARGRPLSRLSPPAVVGAAAVFVAAPIRATLAPSRKPRPALSRLGLPSVVSAVTTFRPVQTTLARTPRQGFQTHSHLFPPVVAPPAFVAPALSVKLTSRRGPRLVSYRIGTPVVVAAATVFRPVSVYDTAVGTRVRWPRPTHSMVRAPTVVTPFVPPETPPLKPILGHD